MKKLIVQVDIHPSKLVGDNFHNLSGRTRNEDLIERSKRSMKQYAKRYKADYELIEEPEDPTRHPWCERFRLFREEKYDKYDAILYVDIDVIVKSRATSIWLHAKGDSFLAAKRHPDNDWIIELWKKHAVNAMPEVDINEYVKYQMNSGVILFGQQPRRFINNNMNWDRMDKWYWKDQMELSYVCMLAEQAEAFKFGRLPWVWNDDTISNKGYFHHHKGEARKRK